MESRNYRLSLNEKKIISVMIFIFFVVYNFSLSNENRNNYSGKVVYEKYFFIDEDSLKSESYHLPMFVSNDHRLVYYPSKDTLIISINSGFEKDDIEIFFNSKSIYNNRVSTARQLGYSDRILIHKDINRKENILNIRMNGGKTVEIILDNKLNIINIDYLFGTEELQITNTNYFTYYS